jgi:hypothetical protein
MLISHRYKFVCINIPKTGTATREAVFKNYIDLWFKDKKFKVPYFIPRHSPAYVAKREFSINGWNWDDYFKFAFVRNPWYRYISLYEMQIRNPFYGIQKDFNSWVTEGKLGAAPNQDYYYLEKNRVILDKVYKYENLEDSIKEICSIVGIKESLFPLPNLRNVPSGGTMYDLSKYYTDQTLHDFVKSIERDVIDRAGYTMPISSSFIS